MIDYTTTTAIFGIATVIAIFRLIRKHSLSARYTIWWIAISAAVLVFTLFPWLADKLVSVLGISYAPTFFFFSAILMIFLKILFMDIDRSKQEVRIRRLLQRLALVEAELDSLKSDKDEAH